MNTAEVKPFQMLVAVDSYSNFVIAKLMEDKRSDTVAIAIMEIISVFGKIGNICSDGGPCFIAEDLRKLLEWWTIIHTYTTAYRPQSNGLAERYIGIIKNSMKCSIHTIQSIEKNYMDKPRKWKLYTQHLAEAVLKINVTNESFKKIFNFNPQSMISKPVTAPSLNGYATLLP